MAGDRSPVTCHVLDASLGRPAANISVLLHELDPQSYQATTIAEGLTDSDGRCTTLLPSSHKLAAGIYKLQFKTKEYFEQSGREAFYPIVEVTFNLTHPDQHYHVPLLLSPWSYTTYRGS